MKAKQAAKKPAAPRVLKNDTNNKYSRAYHAAKRKGLSKEEAGPCFLKLICLLKISQTDNVCYYILYKF